MACTRLHPRSAVGRTRAQGRLGLAARLATQRSAGPHPDPAGAPQAENQVHKMIRVHRGVLALGFCCACLSGFALQPAVALAQDPPSPTAGTTLPSPTYAPLPSATPPPSPPSPPPQPPPTPPPFPRA